MPTFDNILISGSENCHQDEFDCELGMPECIPDSWVCDGESECNNGKDETTAACSEQSQISIF